jgi:L-fuculose-phosphate aldolase
MNDDISKLIKICNNVYEKQLVSGKSGNVSIKISDYIAITPTLKPINGLDEKDIVLVDMDGNPLTKGKPSSEVEMHLGIYKKREDVNAIVHTHSPYATGFSFNYEKIKILEDYCIFYNTNLSSVDFEQPGSKELALKASEAISKNDALILKKHGVLCVGKNLKETESLANFIEEAAKTQFVSIMLNSVKDI